MKSCRNQLLQRRDGKTRSTSKDEIHFQSVADR
jgi:hypothetical protein